MNVVALPMGPHGVLLETDGDPVVLAAHVRAEIPGLVEVVPAARTVLVTADDPAVVARVRDLVAHALDLTAAPASPDPTGPVTEVPVRYDGDDLAEVAERTGLGVAEVVRRHSAATYRVAFCGFAPGFAYLEGLDAALWIPRRTTPRTRVPAGAVAIAAHYSAVYPSASPGGWHLLGTTQVSVWDERRSPPALLAPGTLVRFVVTTPEGP